MNERIRQLAIEADIMAPTWNHVPLGYQKFAELIVQECVNREELLGAIARSWCSEKNQHKTMDSDLALAIFDEVERQIKQHFGVDK